ncbi:uncharacterized protein BKA78DRAFT_304904 [Phyllosticta capitalensis]|uniref:uncharacterized protein n=1 Tax=Phyllosticta capitalensis TaxID=121624 RepID=UPI00312DDA97
MSFGCRPTTKIRSLLNEAKGKGILMFAATSNHGGRFIKFPASSDEVFAIDCADCTGGRSSGNPGANIVKPHRFSALGEILSLKGSIYGSARTPKLAEGTSFATPIAAATAAAILEFANQPPLVYDPLALKGLKMLEGMRAVLTVLFSTKKEDSSEFHHINIKEFEPMNGDDNPQWNEGGNWDSLNSDRWQAAEMICRVLKDTVDRNIGYAMREKMEEKIRREEKRSEN